MAFIISFIMLATILTALFFESKDKFPRLKRFFTSASKGYKYNGIITFVKEGFLPCVFFGVLNLISMVENPNYDYFSIINVIITLMLLLVSGAFFVFSFWLIVRHNKDLHKKELKESFEELIADCKPGLINYFYIIIYLSIRVIYTLDVLFL